MISQEAQWLLKEKYSGEKSEGFFADVKRLEAGEPLAYIIGHIPFLNCTIYLDNHPLIPRVETEYWVARAIEEIKSAAAKPPRVLDLCAGSGCIGVAVAKAIPEAVVHFAELDPTLHATISKNNEANGINPQQTQIFGGNLFEETENTYDFILINPPYLPENSQHVAESVKKYEPPLALYSGNDGLEIIKQIITESKMRLSPSGVIYIEHEPNQSNAIRSFSSEYGLFCTTHTDQYKVSRYSRIAVAQ